MVLLSIQQLNANALSTKNNNANTFIALSLFLYLSLSAAMDGDFFRRYIVTVRVLLPLPSRPLDPQLQSKIGLTPYLHFPFVAKTNLSFRVRQIHIDMLRAREKKWQLR